MKKVLLVEDDQHKADSIVAAVNECRPSTRVDLQRSVSSAIRSALRQTADCMILDMSLTTFDVGPEEEGGKPQPFGGVEILRQLDRRDIHIPSLVITQFEQFGYGQEAMDLNELDRWLNKEHGASYRGLVSYSSSSSLWQRKLAEKLTEILGKE